MSTFNPNIGDVHTVAREVVIRMKRVYTLYSNAKAELPTPAYNYVWQIPATSLSFLNYINGLSAKGFGYSALAPTVAEIFGYSDALTLESTYDNLKNSVQAASDWVIANAAIFTHSIDSEGQRQYNIDIVADKKAELTTKINDVLSFFG